MKTMHWFGRALTLAAPLGLLPACGGGGDSGDDAAPPSAQADLTGGPAATARLDPTCRSPEQTVFSCTTRSGVVAVCASADLAQSAGWLQYRFGKIGDSASQKRLPDDANLQAFRQISIFYDSVLESSSDPDANEGAIVFDTPDDAYRYLVYTRTENGTKKGGVRVLKGDQPLSDIPCQGYDVTPIDYALVRTSGIRQVD